MTRVDLGAAVKDERKRQGMTQPSLAAAVGISDSMVNLIESGRRNPGADTLDRIADVLDVTDDTRAAWHALRRDRATRSSPTDRLDELEGRFDRLEVRFDRLERLVTELADRLPGDGSGPR